RKPTDDRLDRFDLREQQRPAGGPDRQQVARIGRWPVADQSSKPLVNRIATAIGSAGNGALQRVRGRELLHGDGVMKRIDDIRVGRVILGPLLVMLEEARAR